MLRVPALWVLRRGQAKTFICVRVLWHVRACRMVIGHVQRIALVDYLSALGIAVPPYKGINERT